MPAKENLLKIIEKYPNAELDQACWSEIQDGWIPLFEEFVQKLSMLGFPVVLEQVKEKFGQLRIYSHLKDLPFDSKENKQVELLVEEYEIRSTAICESCGSPGKIREYFSDGTPRRLILCLCENCNQPKKKIE